MNRILLGICLSAMLGVAQAGTLEIANSSNVSFKGYDGQPQTVTGAESRGSWGSLFATSAGWFTATYLGQESAFTDHFAFGLKKAALLESFALGTTISEYVKGPGTVTFKFADNNGWDHINGSTFWNGQQQTSTLGFAIMNGQTNQYGTFDYILGFNDSYKGDADYDDFVVGVKFSNVNPIPEPQTYAMLLAGLGLLAFSARRRKDQTYS